MDEMDRKILRHLQKDPDASINALAEQVGLSHTPCWRRLKRMETQGVILGRAVILDPRKLGLGVDVFAHVRLKMHDEETLNALERATSDHPEIVECFSMSGESDYMMRVVVGSIDDYERFLKRACFTFPALHPSIPASPCNG